MHEQSETIQLPSGQWINIYGRGTPQAGQQLPGTPNYGSVEEAVAAAKARSASHSHGALSEHEEFELLSLERERAVSPAVTAAPGSSRYVVEPNDLQRRAGIRRARFKDENLAGNVARGFLSMGEDAGTGAINIASAAGASPGVANVAGFLANVGTDALPVGGGMGASAKVGEQVVETGAKKLMQQAIGPRGKELATGEAARAIDTMLQEGVSATAGGAAKLRLKINELKAQVADVIAQSPHEVDTAYVYRELQNLLDEVSKKGSGYPADQAAVLKAWNEFKNNPIWHRPAPARSDLMSMQSADTVKRASQQDAEAAYNAMTKPTSADEAQMAIARGIRRGMEAKDPVVNAMNAKLSEYLNALYLIEPRVAAQANRQLAGLVPIAPSAEQAMMMLADRNPWMKSYIARALHAGRRAIPEAAGGAYVAGQVTDKQ